MAFYRGGGLCFMAAVVDEVVYVGNLDSYLYALDALTGDELWRFKASKEVYGSPSVVAEVVYVGSDDGNLYHGRRRWC